MADTENPNAETAKASELANHGTGTFTWNLTAFEQQGNLWLRWNTDSPFRAQQGQIHVYKGEFFPSNPTDDTQAWEWDNDTNPWNTGLRWGSDWFCAYIAQASPNGPYKYFIRLVTQAPQKAIRPAAAASK